MRLTVAVTAAAAVAALAEFPAAGAGIVDDTPSSHRIVRLFFLTGTEGGGWYSRRTAWN